MPRSPPHGKPLLHANPPKAPVHTQHSYDPACVCCEPQPSERSLPSDEALPLDQPRHDASLVLTDPGTLLALDNGEHCHRLNKAWINL